MEKEEISESFEIAFGTSRSRGKVAQTFFLMDVDEKIKKKVNKNIIQFFFLKNLFDRCQVFILMMMMNRMI